MLLPDFYESAATRTTFLAQSVEQYILREIARRIQKEARVPATAWKETNRLLAFGHSQDWLMRELARLLGILQSEITTIFSQSYDTAVEDTGYLYEALGTQTRLMTESLRQSIQGAVTSQTDESFRNYTQSIGFLTHDRNGNRAFTPLSGVYHWALDTASERILHAGVPAGTAIREAVLQLAASGLQTVDYESGKRIRLQSAVRTALVTGMHQISGEISLQQAAELETDLVEASAHSGARDKGDGFKNHKSWQGGVYSVSGSNPKYPSLVQVTGYGDVAGLKGANCRHDIGIFVDGVSKRRWTKDALSRIDRAPFSYHGETYTVYKATQRQRGMERSMQDTQNQLIILHALADEDEKSKQKYEKASFRFTQQREEYLKFSSAAKLPHYLERARTIGWTKSESASVSAAAKRGKKLEQNE